QLGRISNEQNRRRSLWGPGRLPRRLWRQTLRPHVALERWFWHSLLSDFTLTWAYQAQHSRPFGSEPGESPHQSDPPPLKWSDLRYVFDIQEDCNGKEAIQA